MTTPDLQQPTWMRSLGRTW